MFFDFKQRAFSEFADPPVPWSPADVWVRPVRHPTDHREAPHGQQGLCATRSGAVH